MQNAAPGHHKGNSTERLLQINWILENLEIKPGETVMDAGCGGGYMSLLFAELTGAQGEVIALDRFSTAAADLFTDSSFDNIRQIVSDITTTTPIQSGSVDLLYLSNVYHIFSGEQRLSFKSEARRLLKPDGRLAIVEIDKKPMPFGPQQSYRVSPEELVRDINLKAAGDCRAGEHFFMQVFRKDE